VTCMKKTPRARPEGLSHSENAPLLAAKYLQRRVAIPPSIRGQFRVYWNV
jgi:hypothetical protein